MKKMNRSLIAVVMGTALATGAAGLIGARMTSVAQAEPEHRKHEKLRDADRALAEAEAYIRDSKDDFHGRKETLMRRINEARTEISLTLDDRTERRDEK